MPALISDLEALWAGVAASPADRAPRLVLLDWLVEHEGDPALARTYTVIAAGQRWQLGNEKWPSKGTCWIMSNPVASRPSWCWWLAGRTGPILLGGSAIQGGSAELPREVFGQLQPSGAVPVRFEGKSLPAAEWALAVALDRLAWAGASERAVAERAKADGYDVAALIAQAGGRVDRPVEYWKGERALPPYEPPAPPAFLG